MEINVKCGVQGLEITSGCSLGAGLPGQARSKWVKVNQSESKQHGERLKAEGKTLKF
jgi:hypothetical protein